ncbi:E3 ubiquitin-protein ligase ARI4 [Apiospora marii]|uniref:RBR-type E3 ubiquitin transferase n=1 Tax=Apiospora marii TaxID=335849 RepID=A0ABR1SNI7_9PEZI
MTSTPNGVKPRWKGKGKEIIRKPVPKTTVAEDDAEEAGDPVDWTQYEPPEGLKTAYDVETDLILDLLKDSIATVKRRIADEAVRKIEIEAFNFDEGEAKGEAVETEQTEDPAPETAQSQTRPDQPTREAPTPVPETDHGPAGPSSVDFAGTKLTIDQHGLLRPAPIPPKSTRRRLLGLLRRLKGSGKAESSSAAASSTRDMRSESSLDLDARLNALLTGRRDSQAVRTESALGNSTDCGSSIHREQVECVSCLDDFDLNEMVKAPCHSYCQDCFTRLITSACEHEQHWPPKCCLNTIPEPTILTLTDEDLKQRYRSRAEEWNIPVSERVYCHQPECSAWLRPDRIDRALNVARCDAGHSTCTLCRGAQHELTNGQGACPHDRDIQRTEELAEEAGWKRCTGCHAYVEHSDACQHMTCRCGAQFCYVCGARWRTCGCTMEQLAAVKSAARKRQEQRALRQAREESEAAEAIRLVAEFEREEARKRQLLLRERERRRAETRRRELKERITLEENRRAAVVAKFAELRGTLEELHALQHVAVVQELDRRAAVLAHEAQVARTALGETNDAKREKLRSDAAAKLAARRKELDDELASRIKEERRVEEQYLAQLQAHYHWVDVKRNKIEKGKHKETDDKCPDNPPPKRAAVADVETERLMKAFRRRNDEGFAMWRKWKDGEWESYHFRVTEKRDIMLETLDVTETRLDESAEREHAAFKKERRAHLRWVDVVIEERQKMLAEMETEERDNGGEDIAAWIAEQEAMEAIAAAALEDLPPSPSDQTNRNP